MKAAAAAQKAQANPITKVSEGEEPEADAL
jgi:hypothetical protein